MSELHKPQIEVYWSNSLVTPELLDYVLQGIEEEGVPYHTVQQELPSDATQLSAKAALESSLEVGIGWDNQGNLALHHRRLPDDESLFRADWPHTPESLRVFGSHAARLVKGLPFKFQQP